MCVLYSLRSTVSLSLSLSLIPTKPLDRLGMDGADGWTHSTTCMKALQWSMQTDGADSTKAAGKDDEEDVDDDPAMQLVLLFYTNIPVPNRLLTSLMHRYDRRASQRPAQNSYAHNNTTYNIIMCMHTFTSISICTRYT